MRTWFLVILLVAAFGPSMACDRPPPLDSTPERAEKEVAPAVEEEPVRERCVIDDQCHSFYRCIQQECAVPPAITGEADSDTPRVIFRDENEKVLAQFHLELALTGQEQSRGLMHRIEMRDEWGMLFIYPREQNLSFWMKNTLISLDMIFINAAGEVVGVVHQAEPETLDPRSVGRPARYVLEVNGGLAERYGIDRGAQMSLTNVDNRHKPRP